MILHLEVELARRAPAWTSTLADSSAPTGIIRRQVGQRRHEGVDACQQIGSATSLALSSSPMHRLHQHGRRISPLPLSMPTCLDSVLRLACRLCVRVWLLRSPPGG